MRYREFIPEARKNPEKNPKAFVNDEIYTELDKVIKSNDKVAGSNDNLFVSFTGVDKLGINPTSKYNTPLGIYSYPAGYVKSKVGKTNSMNHLPFAGDSPYATIFKARGNIIDLTDISDREVNEYYKKIAEYWSKVSGKDWKTSVDQVEDIINDAPYNAKISSYEGGKLWYVTMKVAGMIARKKPAEKQVAKPDAVSWNTLFRSIGVSGCVDNGAGIIHTSEPHQAVFFDIGAVSVIKRVYNRANYNPREIKHNARMGADLKQYMTNQYNKFRNMSVADQEAEALKNPSNLRFLTHVSDDLKYKLLFKKPSNISYIRNPTEAMKEFVIKVDPNNIQYIKKPSTALQKLAVSMYGNSIKHIINVKTDPNTNEKKISIYPSEEIQKIAVKDIDAALITIINSGIKPSEAVQQIAVRNFNYLLKILIHHKITPSDTVQQIAVGSDPYLIEKIMEADIKPSETVQQLAVKGDPNTLDAILKNGIVPSVTVVNMAGVSAQWLVNVMKIYGVPLSPELKQWAGVQ
jgi:hypothetical protein